MSGTGSEPQPTSAGDIVGGCILLVLLFAVGSCMFGGEDEDTPAAPAPRAEVAQKQTLSSQPAKPETSSQPNVESPSAEAESGPVRLADLDEADRAIRLAINLSGHLCAKPIEVMPSGSPDL